MNKTLYLSGAITHNPNHKRQFAEAAEKLRVAGYNAINPVEDIATNKKSSWLKNMIVCLSAIDNLRLDGIALIAFDTDSFVSAGAEIEKITAREIGLEVQTIDWWIDKAKKELAS